MIGQTNVGTNNLEKADEFYSQVLAFFGARQIYKTDRSLVYAFGEGSSHLAVNTPYDGKPATPGNGCMVGLQADSRQKVDTVHAKALELGGNCEGPPGERYGGRLYAAYFRDLDGNKFGVLHMAG